MRRSAAVYHKFTEEEIRQANSVDILSLARGYGYEPEKAGRKAVHMKHRKPVLPGGGGQADRQGICSGNTTGNAL